MRKITFLFAFLFLAMGINAQQEAAIWYFGRNAGLDFRSGVPVALTDGEVDTEEGCATISDFNGNLLFYTDGSTVWDRNHNPMPNGTGLRGHSSSTQSGIIVPSPGNPDIYYVFTARYQVQGGIYYSVVDMTLNSGLGDITVKNVVLEDPATEKLTAVEHANGRDVWVIAHDWGNNAFLAYLVTPTGVNTTPVRSNVGFNLNYLTVGDDVYKARGAIKASADGSKLAVCHSYVGVELLDFNTATGQVSNPFVLMQDPDRDFYSAEFSPSGDILYISVIREDLYQFDLRTTDILGSMVTITSPHYTSGGLQLAIDGKIYMAHYGDLSVIHNPDIAGLGCNFEFQTIDLGGRRGDLGLPPFVTSFFNIGFTFSNTCLGDLTDFQINSSDPIVSILWDFGDGNTSNTEDPAYTFAAPGTYTVSVTVTTAAETKTESKEVTIFAVPVANPAADFEVCSPDPAYGFDLSTKDVEVLGAQSATDFTVAYYPSLADAQGGTNALPTMYVNTDPIETVFARVSNNGNTACYDIISFDLTVKQAPVLHPVTDWTVCDTDTDGLFAFDLSTRDGEVLNGQDPADFTVSYHTTQADADNAINPIGPNYTNTATPETLYFRIANSTYPECYETGSFSIEVIDQVVAHRPQDLDYCDGEAVFDLTAAQAEIIGSQNPAGLVLSYHESQADADTGSDPLNAADYLSAAYQNTIYVRVANVSDANCYDTTSFQLNIFDTPIPPDISDWQVCDDDNDGRHTFELTEKANEILDGTTGTSVSFYLSQDDADNAINALGGGYRNTANPQTVYFRMENTNHPDCYGTGSFQLQVFDTPTAHVPEPLIACATDGTGIRILDLSVKDAEVLDGQDADSFTVLYFATQTDADNGQDPITKTAYTNSSARETLYARIQNNENEDCYDTASFELIINPWPQAQLEDTYVICPDSPELNLDGGDFESWSWRDENGTEIGTDRTLDITELGNYSLTVARTQNGVTCEGTVSFEVISSGAPDDFTTEIVGFGDRIAIEVTATGVGEFEYSVDGENYQDSDRLEVFPGEYTVYVRDRFLCRTLEKEIVALGYQKFFTPNGDGSHEHWNVIGAEAYPGSTIRIYDRYGKLMAQVLPDGPGWDGTFRGVAMPSSDYWFRYELQGGRAFTGHFTLKR